MVHTSQTLTRRAQRSVSMSCFLCGSMYVCVCVWVDDPPVLPLKPCGRDSDGGGGR